MKFIAKAKGYLNDRIIEPGSEFEADKDFSASWAEKAGDYKPEKKPSDEQLAKDAKEGLQGKKKSKKKSKKKTAKKADKE